MLYFSFMGDVPFVQKKEKSKRQCSVSDFETHTGAGLEGNIQSGASLFVPPVLCSCIAPVVLGFGF